MNKYALVLAIALNSAMTCQAENPSACAESLKEKVVGYFADRFTILEKGAAKNPDKENFREIMEPLVKNLDGMYGATLIGTNWIIRQVYFPKHFMARSFDLKTVEGLKDFRKEMNFRPAPQLSEPAQGGIMQPSLISLRQPVIINGNFVNIVSMMFRTEDFLKTVGLDKARSFEIICRGKTAVKRGEISKTAATVTLDLPSTHWVIRYDD